jgi:hypothetical protein
MYREAMGGARADESQTLDAAPSWRAAAELAAAYVPRAIVDEAGGFVPPQPIADVTAPAVLALAQAWQAMRPMSRVTAGDDGPVPVAQVLAFSVAGPPVEAKSTKKKTK